MLTKAGETAFILEALRSLADKAEALLNTESLKYHSLEPDDSPHADPEFARLTEELEASIAWARKVLEGG